MPPGGPVTSDSDMESVFSVQLEKSKVRCNSGALKYYCSIEGCEESFKRLDHLDRHEYKHNGIKKHACHYEDCNKSYTIVTHLKRHIRTTHERLQKEPNKNVPCELDTCDKLFTSLTNMQRHVREVHENPKVYKCQFCDEKFTQKLKMRRHEISKHTGVYPYNCDKCSKGFYQEWQCEKHEESCKVYSCPSCGIQFDKWTLFLKHCKETQHSRKYYKCEHCSRFYVKPSELQKHVAAKHLGEGTEVYKCSYEGCQKFYAYERNLRQHIVTVHEGKKFSCTENNCDKEFSSLQNLQKHLKRDHKKNSPQEVEPSTITKPTLKRKKRKDAGKSKIANLVQLSGIAVDKDLNKRLKSREQYAIEEVAEHLSQEMDINSNSEEDNIELDDRNNEDDTKDVVNMSLQPKEIKGILKNSLKSTNKNDFLAEIMNANSLQADEDIHKSLDTVLLDN